jgi:hypothetical protein
MERNASIAWSALALLWSGCFEGDDHPRGNAYEFVDLISELDTGCIHYHTGIDAQRLSNKRPTRQVIVKRMTENNPMPAGPRVTIQDILFEPGATYRPIVAVRRSQMADWSEGLLKKHGL